MQRKNARWQHLSTTITQHYFSRKWRSLCDSFPTEKRAAICRSDIREGGNTVYEDRVEPTAVADFSLEKNDFFPLKIAIKIAVIDANIYKFIVTSKILSAGGTWRPGGCCGWSMFGGKRREQWRHGWPLIGVLTAYGFSWLFLWAVSAR